MKLISLIFMGVALCAPATGFAADRSEHLKVQRLDDTVIDAYLERPTADGRHSILLSFQGSKCSTVSPGGDRLPIPTPPGVARLFIEKYAVTPTTKGSACPPAYLANNTIDGRVLDALTVVAHLRANAPWWNGRLYLAGASEGAVVAAITGSLAGETEGLILINGPLGRPFREGMTETIVESVRSGGGDAAAQQAAREQTAATWTKARATPTIETAFGDDNTLRWWASIIDSRPSNLLVNVRAPILVIQSEKDQMSPPSAARAVEARFRAAGKTNLTYRELPGLDHGFRDAQGKPVFEPLLRESAAFLAEREKALDGAGSTLSR